MCQFETRESKLNLKLGKQTLHTSAGTSIRDSTLHADMRKESRFTWFAFIWTCTNNTGVTTTSTSTSSAVHQSTCKQSNPTANRTRMAGLAMLLEDATKASRSGGLCCSTTRRGSKAQARPGLIASGPAETALGQQHRDHRRMYTDGSHQVEGAGVD